MAWQIVEGKFVEVADTNGQPTGIPAPMEGGPSPVRGEVDYISLAPILDTTPLEDALEKICKEIGLKVRPGGASRYGWSTRSLLLACPFKYKKLYLDKPKNGLKGKASTALEVGSLFHQLLAFRYLQMMPEQGGLKNPVDYAWVKTRLLEENVAAEVIMESFRLFDSYQYRYENDYLVPLDVEIEAQDADGNTCRFDTIVQVEEGVPGVPPGVYICEHKTAARFDFATLESWKNDGQIIQQMHIFKKARLKKKYGELAGIIINLVSKTKTVDFRRIVIAPQTWQLRQHAKDLRVWDAMENFFVAVGVFPRNRASCRGPYGLCPLFEHCAGDAK